jgi:hypothetical protein
MLKLFISLVFSIGVVDCFAQKEIIYTDSSKIEIESFSKGKFIYEFPNHYDVIYYRYIDLKEVVRISGAFDKHKNPIRKWYFYDSIGYVERIEDYSEGTWQIFNTRRYPYKYLLDSIKHAGDSCLRSIYGKEFCDRNIRWNMQSSAFYDKSGAGNSWTEDASLIEPDRFSVVYDILLDNEVYRDLIIVELDRNRILLPPKISYPCRGFEKLHGTFNGFRITRKIAIEKLVADHFLQLQEDKTVYGLLRWECLVKPSDLFFNGHFSYLICRQVSSRLIDSYNKKVYFDVFRFDPWKCNYIGKKRMFVVVSVDDNLSQIDVPFLSKNLQLAE